MQTSQGHRSIYQTLLVRATFVGTRIPMADGGRGYIIPATVLQISGGLQCQKYLDEFHWEMLTFASVAAAQPCKVAGLRATEYFIARCIYSKEKSYSSLLFLWREPRCDSLNSCNAVVIKQGQGLFPVNSGCIFIRTRIYPGFLNVAPTFRNCKR